MNWAQFWENRIQALPAWPSERQWVTIGLFVLTGSMLKMAEVNPKLWDVKLFEILIQAIMLTGIINMVLAFHFSANKSGQDLDTKRADNTGKVIDLARDSISNSSDISDKEHKSTAKAVDEVADAATEKAQEIKDKGE